MADPFALMNRTLERNARVKPGSGRLRKARDPNNPKDREYLQRMHPDFEEVMVSANLDYRTQCQTDANFASKFRIPPVVEPQKVFREHTNSVDAVCWGPDPGSFLSASHDHTLKVWDVQSGRSTATLSGHSAGVYHCAVSGSRQLIISCGSGETQNVLVWRWPQQQPKPSQALQGHRRSVIHATFSDDSLCASTVDQEGTVVVHDLAHGKPKMQRGLHVGAVHGSSFCRGEPNLLCTAGGDGTIQVVDLREAAAPPVWCLPSAVANYASMTTSLGMRGAHDRRAVYAVEFMDRGTIFSGGADHKLKRWDLRMVAPWTPKCVGEYLGHTGSVRSLAVAPDQRFIVTGCEDGSLRIWPKDSLGDTRASLKDTKAQIKQVEIKLEVVTLPDEAQELHKRKAELKSTAATLRSSEEQLAREGHQSAVRTLNGHVGLISGCAWQEDSGKTTASILSSSWDQSIQLFNLNLQELAAPG